MTLSMLWRKVSHLSVEHDVKYALEVSVAADVRVLLEVVDVELAWMVLADHSHQGAAVQALHDHRIRCIWKTNIYHLKMQ